MKTKYTLHIFLCVLALGLGFFLLSRPASVPTSASASNSKQSEQAAGGTLTAEEKFVDLGKISMAAGKVQARYAIKNTSSETALVKKISTSCMCTVAELAIGGKQYGPFGMEGHGGRVPSVNVEIPAGASAEIIATFDPAAHGPAGIGRADRVIFIETGNGEPVELRLVATVTP